LLGCIRKDSYIYRAGFSPRIDRASLEFAWASDANKRGLLQFFGS
jgi:hypothetical protein